MNHNYIMALYDDRYEIIGPFVTCDALVTAGRKWQAENGDRPTWQSIYLADPHAAPRVVAP